ncbi:MAG: Aspartate-semialdehyde dehydrogenase [Candidatus Nomurabacteria bacterium GW2011_GWF2_35_66]|uniref:Aspartate-semialdehyde dehydrogenase n=1 Tax=Candidatus Nomurabacteria bacterium GW2011_GWE1_35_16 TaxID=1618761 RepID=A0A0G0EHQ9_9BACT|nr:MAG: Aspartate-semialdehyde dehydrogenase [Candidatus Nomurabacteria bacterium GW2011_GWF1_34_20]KKP63625.1 MAG: Aspartate-semialdehyde dehydrogenase [Candidatus Nomurabacteria bacterium GW2011_GWE2_34_25]KKP66827.1 MAG: Aspartate-semialdehyde dehydrogenase [Candidatus Nomurabacteria bacterium GW2011_GWE1_35_16]KKP83453.1 MAG: Aspartate-semialdehyde dehydrogenase [Candidatus Nomurabacteria bacterium GW2011_GWF2_35_66]HAE36615.1 aspartate-semialdehyde dehydrogenase [Candidatus Nomurabacteria 
MQNKKLAIVGVTGLVGQEVLNILVSKKIVPDIDVDNLLFVASDKSVGKVISFLGKEVKVISVEDAILEKPDYVIMSAGATLSKEVAPRFVEGGAIVIDNSSAWRTFPEIPLIVPSIPNPLLDLNMKSGIIANPNCVAIMIAIAIAPFSSMGVDMVLVSVMQSVSGAGYKGINALREELENNDGVKASMSSFVSNIANNIIPASAMSSTVPKYNDEEAKMMFEVPKILGKSVKFSSQSCRVPVARGHSAMMRVFFKEEQDEANLIDILKKAPQIKYSEEPLGPYDTVGKDYVIVRSFRQDINNKNVFEFFVASDNLRVGAAYNAVAILGKLLGVYNEKNYS